MPAGADDLYMEAARRDAQNPLQRFAERFYKVPGRIYLDGNSLGLLSRDAESAVLAVLADWREHAVEGWTRGDNPWFFLSEKLSVQVAPLIGANADSVIVTGSTTGNLHQLLATLYTPNPARPVIVADALAFPSDIYAIESHLRLRGLDPVQCLRKIPSCDGFTLSINDILAALTHDVQMVVLPSVLFVSGQLLDMVEITRACQTLGIVIGWDLSHSVGAVPHVLKDIGADFAFWCHYKYLNAGPGAVGGLYLNARHFGKAPGLAGWFGSRKETQFDMDHAAQFAHGAAGLQIGTPHILSLAPLLGTLALHHEAGIETIRQVSLEMTAFLRTCVQTLLHDLNFGDVTPRADDARGGHISLTHSEAARICRGLRMRGVVPDYRPPCIIRLAPAPLYTTFTECVQAVETLRDIATGPTAFNEPAELVP